jgi:ADP-heptose:LPS heptosyltransferase
MSGNSEPQKIAVLCLSALGDFINSIPVLCALRGRFPQAELTVVCERSGTAQLARACNLADEVVLLPPGLRRNPIKLAQAAMTLRRLGADIAVQTFASHGTCANILLFCTRAGVRAGLADGLFRAGATVAVPLVDDKHVIELNLEVLEAAGLGRLPRPSDRYFPLLEDLSANFGRAKLLATYAPYVAIATGCDPALTFKRWGDEKWIALGKKIAATGRKVVFLGDRLEESRVRPLLSHIGEGHAVDLCGETSFEDLASVVGNSDLVVGVDGMILHVAAAMQKHCVSLFGPTDERLIGPWGQAAGVVRAPIDAKPWYRATTVGMPMPNDAPDYMGALDVDTVWKVVEERLNAVRGV